MTPTIDQIEAALPYVPAGICSGDLTEPDERREFAEVIHGIVVQATTGHTDPNPAPLVEWGVDEVRVNWGPPKPGDQVVGPYGLTYDEAIRKFREIADAKPWPIALRDQENAR